ncbi:hypothetical protein HZS_665 [Henneguya salminicola]|nr:hypothetical protein HZS_665 [Henneguya salminicola]
MVGAPDRTAFAFPFDILTQARPRTTTFTVCFKGYSSLPDTYTYMAIYPSVEFGEQNQDGINDNLSEFLRKRKNNFDYGINS